jgi:hypothetical protein
MTKRDLKIIAATLTVVGAILSILDKIYAPHVMEDTGSPNYPNFLRLLAWLFLLVPPLIYIWLDRENLFSKKKKDNSR